MVGGCDRERSEQGGDASPRADATVRAGGFGEVVVDDGDGAETTALDVALLRELTDKQQTGWLLEGTDPPGCDEDSLTCRSLTVRIPVDAEAGIRPCGTADTSLAFFDVQPASPWVQYQAAAEDGCTLMIDDGDSAFVAVRDIDVVIPPVADAPLRLTGYLVARHR